MRTPRYEQKRAKPQFPTAEILALPPAAFGEEFDIFFFGADASDAFEIEGKYAVVDVRGPLEQHRSFWLDNYDSIRSRVKAAFASDQEEVALRINSPGGSFSGCLELAREVRAMAAAAKKPLVAFVDTQALSAGYALACAASRIVITPSASVGSVGVWSALVDVTAQDAARGLKVEIVASDDHKADRNPHVKMTDATVDRLRAEVEEMAEMFREEVAEGRGMRPSSLRKLKGSAVFGENAVKARLADRIVDSWEAFVQGGSSRAKSEGNDMSLYSKAAMQKAAAEGDADAKAALALMAKAEEDEEMKGKKAKEDEKAKSAKAKEDAPIKKDDEKDEKDAKALSDVIARVQAMEASATAREAKAVEDDQRAKLLAERPDFSDAVLEVLALAPIAALEKAVKEFPKSTFRNPNTPAAKALGTAGKDAGNLELGLDAETMALFDRKMPLGGKAPVAFAVGCGDPDAARRFLAAQEAARKVG